MLTIGVLVALASVVVFRSRKARIIAALTLLPLLAVGWAIHSAGQSADEEPTDIQEAPTVFGSGEHALGQSHAGGHSPPGPASPGTKEPGTDAGGVDLRALARAAAGVAGLTWPDPGTPYSPRSLSERINGAAEQYKKNGIRAALFATARVGEEDLELQLFDFGDPAHAERHYREATEGADGASLPGAAGQAMTWAGGGEAQSGRFYVRVVSSSGGAGLESKVSALLAAVTQAALSGSLPAPAATGVGLGENLARALALPGLEWPDRGTKYTPRTLSSRINGAAELYTKHGLRASLFATAQVGEAGNKADIEVQLFDMGTREHCAALYAAVTEGSQGRALNGVGDAALLWPGGGELRWGALYARVVLSAAEPTPAGNAAARAILGALGGESPAAPAAAPETGERPTAKDIATQLGIGEHIVKHYGVERVEVSELEDRKVRKVWLRDGYAAAAFAQALRPADAEARRDLGFGSPQLAAVVRGPVTVLVSGEGAERGLEAAAAGLDAPALPGLQWLSGAPTVEVQVGGWSGKAFLGNTLVGRWPDEVEIFVAFPESPKEALARLLEGLESKGAPDAEGITQGPDPYHGDVLLSRRGGAIVGAAGFEERNAVTERLSAVLKRPEGTP